MSGTREYPGTELELFRRAVNWKDYLRRRLAGYVGRRVLEVGAGLGATTEFLWRRDAGRWVCLEPDPRLARRLLERRVEGELPSSCRVVRGGTEALRSGDRFDTVLYVDVLEHIRDDAAELGRAARLLAPGGHLVVLAPAHPFLFTPFDRAVGHHRRYGRDSLLRLGPAGMKVAEARYLDSAGLLASLANRLLLRSSMPSPGQVRFWDRFMVPSSRFLDPATGYRLGKSVLVVWRAGPRGRGSRAGAEGPVRTERTPAPGPPPGSPPGG